MDMVFNHKPHTKGEQNNCNLFREQNFYWNTEPLIEIKHFIDKYSVEFQE